MRYSRYIVDGTMRYLVKAKVKPGQETPLLAAIESGSPGWGSVAGDEYLEDIPSLPGRAASPYRRARPQLRDNARQLLQHVIHLRVGVIDAETEPDAAARPGHTAAHRRQHV